MAASYLACVAAATYPVALTFGSALPGELTDPLEHLWIIGWTKACLLEGRAPFFCGELQHPTGVPLGYFPTMHLQSAAFLLLGLVTSNDVARFNAVWSFGFASTGVSTFLLAWWATRRAWPSWLAGLGAMLSGPMLMHAHGHLETMQMGAVPLFLVGWLRFVDRPGPGRLAMAAALYLLVVASAPYFAVLAIFPAAWYVAWAAFASAGPVRWLAGRIGWLAGFAAVAVPGLVVLFSGQVWASVHGYAMVRPRAEFFANGAPAWSSLAPSPRHALGRALPDLFAATGYGSRLVECSSYLGVATLALLAYAGARRARFPRAGYWWSVLGLMVVLSWGAQARFGPVKVGLPAGWLYGVFPPLHLIRVPARFNLFAAVCAAVPAAAGLADLLGRIPGVAGRNAIVAGCGALMMADLSMTPFPTSTIPPMPAAYRDLAKRIPRPALVDAPMFGASEGQVFSSLWAYWQSTHRARTSAGYPGLTNVPFDSEVVPASPWWSRRLADPSYLAEPGPERFGPAVGVDARDYAWLFLAAHDFAHVVVHQGTWMDPKYAAGSGRIKALLAEARSFEDADAAVFDRARLRPPDRLAWMGSGGFRPSRDPAGSGAFGVLRRAQVAVFVPGSEGRMLALDLVGASAFARGRAVRLLEGGRELARWTIEPGAPRDRASTPFRLDAGLRRLTLESDGDDRPALPADRLDEARTPYSLRLDGFRLRPVDQDPR